MKTCKVCVMNDSIKGVKIGSSGKCNYCDWDKRMNVEYPISEIALSREIIKIKKQGKGKRYDAVVGVSGGTDSSYMLKLMTDRDVRMLAVHWDNNWNSKIALSNIIHLTNKLGVDLRVRHVEKHIYDMLCKSFLLASTPDADIPNDIALTTVLYEEAEKEGVEVILNGHSFRTEGTCPTGWTYMDGKYIESVNNCFIPVDLGGFPNLTMNRWLRWLHIRRVRPLYHIDYRKKEAKEELRKLGWLDYGGHHAENRYTKFIGTYLWKEKFNQDLRYVSLSAQVRNGHITRDEALKELEKPQYCESDIIKEVKERLCISDTEFKTIMDMPVKSHRDYETYDFYKMKQVFEEFKEYLPKTFVDKYIEESI